MAARWRSDAADPIIVTAVPGAEDFAWLDGLRRAHYPPELNRVPAHITLFHHLPPSMEQELGYRLSKAARLPRPRATAAGIIDLGGGTAIRIGSPDLEEIRADLADALAGMLTPQDQATWRPHITIQNKVEPRIARRLQERLKADFRPRPLVIAALACWSYAGGPWRLLREYKFRG